MRTENLLQKRLRNAWYISLPIGAKGSATNRTVILLLVLAGLAYSLFISAYLSPYAAGADSSGYLNFARFLTHGQVLAPVRALPGLR